MFRESTENVFIYLFIYMFILCNEMLNLIVFNVKNS